MISNLTHRAARALRGRGFDMSRVPDGHVLRRMWAKAGAEEAAPGETKPPEVSFGPSDVIVIGGEPATVEIETEHVDPAETCDAVDGSATSSNDSDDNGAEYERERDARIARNKQRMAHLGIDTLSREVGTDGENRKKNKSASADARRRATKLARTSEQHVAPRRSTRSRTLQNPGVVDDVSEEALIALGETAAALRARQTRRAASTKENSTDSHPTPPPEVFEESAVMRYACRASSSQNNASNNEAHFTKGRCATKNERLRGWEQDNVTFADPKMKKGFYALDVRDGDDHGLSDTTKQSLMVGGGDGGRVAVWALHGNDNDRDYNEKEMDDADTDDTTEDTDAVLPLASWVGHRGWCSHVQFFQNHPGGCPLVLTCGGMDGAVALWDIGSTSRSSGAPREVLRDSEVHGGSGIFSAHCRSGSGDVLTSSKHGGCAVSVLSTQDSKLKTTSRHDEHAGVVKCARWRNFGANDCVFGTCGDDGSARVFDVRVTRAVRVIEHVHGGYPVNFLEWGAAALRTTVRVMEGTVRRKTSTADGNNSNLFVTSATSDHRVLLWDLRQSDTPLASLEGHVPVTHPKPKSLYRPVFVNAGGCEKGLAVCAPGPKSLAVSLFDLDGLFKDVITRNESNESRRKKTSKSVEKSQAVGPGPPKIINPSSRGAAGFDATAVCGFVGKNGNGIGNGNWTLALANRGAISVFRPKWVDQG
jgi:WD40 repeat protein